MSSDYQRFPMNPTQWARFMGRNRHFYQRLKKIGQAPKTLLIGGTIRKRELITETAHTDWLQQQSALSIEFDAGRKRGEA